MWIKWKCEDCGEKFATEEIDEPSCPKCQWEYCEEVCEVEVTDKEGQ